MLTQFKYNALYKPNQLICGTGQTAVVTGWTEKQAIAKHLLPHEFAVIGALYSATRGISLLIRNLLANPHVTHMVVLNATKEDRNAGGCECLLDFFYNGFAEGLTETGKHCWRICSTISGYIDIEIPQPVLEQLRKSIICGETYSIDQAATLTRCYARQSTGSIDSVPLEFPMSTVLPTVLPGTRYGHRIEGETIAETWVKIIHRIKTTGTLRPTGYDGQWQELIDLMAIVTNEPSDFYFPEPNYLPCDRAFIQEYISQILDDAPHAHGVKYTYGQRLRSWFGRDQVEQVIDKLINEIDAASAVMSLWDVGDHERGGSPCLTNIWLRVVDNELSLTATFRSNDMANAWPANAFGLRALQQHIRNEISDRSDYNLGMGPLITLSQSAHIYDDMFEYSDRLLKNHYLRLCNRRKYNDLSGNFIIYVSNSRICVEQTNQAGELVGLFSGRSAIGLYRQIAVACPGIQVEHAFYLGTQLQKAEYALISGNSYTQDA